MSARCYYRKEQRRHVLVAGVRLTFREARRLTKMLAKEHGIPLRKVTVLKRSAKHVGTFKPRRYLIAYKRAGVSLLTVLHEIAHGIHWKLYGRTRRFHTVRHAEIVDDLVRVAIARGWGRECPPPPRPRIALPVNMERRRAA